MNKQLIEDSVLKVVRSTLKLDEAYAASQKSFSLAAEAVSKQTKDLHVSVYKAAVDELNKISAKLETAANPDAGSTCSTFRSLKRDEACMLNSVYLHELYFNNCFDPASEIFVDMVSYMRLQRDWGLFDSWQEDFISCALSCDGWVCTVYNSFLKRYANAFIDGNDCGVLVGAYPVIVVDMHEHAYYRDFGNNKRAYISAMMQTFNWTVIEERVKKADLLHKVIS